MNNEMKEGETEKDERTDLGKYRLKYEALQELTSGWAGSISTSRI